MVQVIKPFQMKAMALVSYKVNTMSDDDLKELEHVGLVSI